MHTHSNTNKQVVFRKAQVDIHVYQFFRDKCETRIESRKHTFDVAILTFLGAR